MVATTDLSLVLRAACDALLNGSVNDAQDVIRSGYPFTGQPAQARKYGAIWKGDDPTPAPPRNREGS